MPDSIIRIAMIRASAYNTEDHSRRTNSLLAVVRVAIMANLTPSCLCDALAVLLDSMSMLAVNLPSHLMVSGNALQASSRLQAALTAQATVILTLHELRMPLRRYLSWLPHRSSRRIIRHWTPAAQVQSCLRSLPSTWQHSTHLR